MWRGAFCDWGAALYQMTLPIAERLYLTDIQAEFEGDTFFLHWI
jgi:hypothetical protein